VVQTLNPYLLHLIGDGAAAVARETVHTGTYEEVGADLLGGTEELVDIALTVSDVNAAIGNTQKGCGLLQILQSADAFFFLDGHPGGVNLLLQGIAAVKLISRPELDGRQPQWQPVQRDRQAGMHQDPADGNVPPSATLVPAANGVVENTNRGHLLAMVGELGRVMQNQYRPLLGQKSFAGGVEMSREDIRFADPIICEETVGGFGVGPVLTHPGNAATYPAGKLLQQLSKPLAQPHIGEIAARQFLINPCIALGIRGTVDLFAAA